MARRIVENFSFNFNGTGVLKSLAEFEEGDANTNYHVLQVDLCRITLDNSLFVAKASTTKHVHVTVVTDQGFGVGQVAEALRYVRYNKDNVYVLGYTDEIYRTATFAAKGDRTLYFNVRLLAYGRNTSGGYLYATVADIIESAKKKGFGWEVFVQIGVDKKVLDSAPKGKSNVFIEVFESECKEDKPITDFLANNYVLVEDVCAPRFTHMLWDVTLREFIPQHHSFAVIQIDMCQPMRMRKVSPTTEWEIVIKTPMNFGVGQSQEACKWVQENHDKAIVVAYSSSRHAYSNNHKSDGAWVSLLPLYPIGEQPFTVAQVRESAEKNGFTWTVVLDRKPYNPEEKHVVIVANREGDDAPVWRYDTYHGKK